ncbi:MAG: glycosyl hydrolase family 18 protein [Actinomycetes bacterium]
MTHNGVVPSDWSLPLRRVITAIASMLALAVVLSPMAEAAPKKIVTGWIPYWMSTPGNPVGVNTAVANADLFSEVSPFIYSALPAGSKGVRVALNPNFSNGAANAAWATNALHAAGILVIPSIADGSGKGVMAKTLADPAKRTAHVQDIVATVVNNGYDGIDLDYEVFAFSDGSASWATTQPNWTAFVTELGAALRGQGKKLIVTIPGPCSTTNKCGGKNGYWVYDMAGIAPAVDRIRIMAYDFHVNGAGPIAPISWVTAIVQYSITVMDPAKLQIGVPTYGRSWTKKKANGTYQLSGNCPTSSQDSKAYSALTSKAAVNDSDIAKVLATNGVPPTDVKWDDASQENYVEYDKVVSWSGGTCSARRIMWFVGPQAVLVRTQLVGTYGISAAAYWTVGGDDPAQWPLIRAYADSLGTLDTALTVTAPPNAIAGAAIPITASVASNGAPLAGVAATLRFKAAGTADFVDVSSAVTGADGSVAFAPIAATPGEWAVFVAGAEGRAEKLSDPVSITVTSSVTVTSAPTKKVKRLSVVPISVSALPALEGQQIVIQLSKAGSWINSGRAKADASGAATVQLKVRKKGAYTYRAVAVGKAGFLTGASAPFRIRVK